MLETILANIGSGSLAALFAYLYANARVKTARSDAAANTLQERLARSIALRIKESRRASKAEEEAQEWREKYYESLDPDDLADEFSRVFPDDTGSGAGPN